MTSKKQYEMRIEQENSWRNELQNLLDLRGVWSNPQADRVEELASLLNYSEEDKFWHA